ncbi:hypothetical protein F511_26484 [Dorcoceras hygrometricum]|uniref:Retrotransposon gag domain-containing protein n=1 Tax=Dorcoceras hygrometricum TaxID=472368 RepID=A0A2Z7D6H3_9LAMI|nr:hypothetical protein F511_26484 [Dorcoceras hygrometricum]
MSLFKKLFYDKYFTPDEQEKLKQEFRNLRQGDMIVDEYIKKFERGCHFSPLIANDTTEKLQHFLDGLSRNMSGLLGFEDADVNLAAGSLARFVSRRSAAGSYVEVFYATPFHLIGTLRFEVSRATSSKDLCISLTLISRWFERPADGSSADLRYATSFGLVAVTPFWFVF